MLHREALLEDCKVMPFAIARHVDAMRTAFQRDQQSTPRNMLPIFWDMPFDRVMHLSRGLHELDADYIRDLQELLVQGRMPVKAINLYTGKAIDVKDPELFTYDTPVMTPTEFAHYMNRYPPDREKSSQEENV